MPIEMPKRDQAGNSQHEGCAQDVIAHEDEQHAANEQHSKAHDVIPGIGCLFPAPAFPEAPDQVDRRQAGDEQQDDIKYSSGGSFAFSY